MIFEHAATWAAVLGAIRGSRIDRLVRSRRQKNDAADAEATCEAVTRPTMRFVEIKSGEQQSIIVLHRVRLTLMRQRIQLSNAIRGHMAEYGLVAPVGRNGLAPGTSIRRRPTSVARAFVRTRRSVSRMCPLIISSCETSIVRQSRARSGTRSSSPLPIVLMSCVGLWRAHWLLRFLILEPSSPAGTSLKAMGGEVEAAPGKQVSLTDPDVRWRPASSPRGLPVAGDRVEGAEETGFRSRNLARYNVTST